MAYIVTQPDGQELLFNEQPYVREVWSGLKRRMVEAEWVAARNDRRDPLPLYKNTINDFTGERHSFKDSPIEITTEDRLDLVPAGWLAVDEDSTEYLHAETKPVRSELFGEMYWESQDVVELPNGTIEFISGKKIKFDDEPLAVFIKFLE